VLSVLVVTSVARASSWLARTALGLARIAWAAIVGRPGRVFRAAQPWADIHRRGMAPAWSLRCGATRTGPTRLPRGSRACCGGCSDRASPLGGGSSRCRDGAPRSQAARISRERDYCLIIGPAGHTEW